jgi:ABC-type branched-subunit amino acid transport system ATPase component
VTKWSLHRIVHEARVVRTFQTMRLFSTMTARENIQVAAGATLRGDRKLRQRSYRRAGERTDEVIDQLDLGNFAHAPVTDLPYGRRRLVEVARALVADPRMLLLDEPAAGLNTADRERLGALLRDLRGQGMTIVLVEHQMDLVSAVCDELTVLDFGSVLCEGPPKAVIEDQRVLSAYLGGGGG